MLHFSAHCCSCCCTLLQEIHELKDQIQDVEIKYTQNLKEVKVSVRVGRRRAACLLTHGVFPPAPERLDAAQFFIRWRYFPGNQVKTSRVEASSGKTVEKPRDVLSPSCSEDFLAIRVTNVQE